MNIKEFKTGLPVRKAVLGIDYGSKRMGLAVSDLSCTIATPYKILYRREISADMTELRKIMAEKEIGAAVANEWQRRGNSRRSPQICCNSGREF